MQAVILAGGESSRFWPLNEKHKSLFKILGKPLLWYTVFGLLRSGIKDIIIVQNDKRIVEKEIKKFFPFLKFVVQKKPLGTGDAVLKAERFLKEPFFVLNAERVDNFLFLPKIKEVFKKKGGIVLLGCLTEKPWEFGVFKLKGDKILDVIEKPKKGTEPSRWQTTGLYFFSLDFLSYLKKVPCHPYSLMQAISLYAKEKEAFLVKTLKKMFFLKYPWDPFYYLDFIFSHYFKEKISPNVFISKKARIEGKIFAEKNCKILDQVFLKGFCYLGENSFLDQGLVLEGKNSFEMRNFIGSGSQIINSIFQENCRVQSSFVSYSILAENCQLAKNVVLNPKARAKKNFFAIVKGKKEEILFKKFGCAIGKNSLLADNVFVEKGVLIGSNVKINSFKRVKENILDETFLI